MSVGASPPSRAASKNSSGPASATPRPEPSQHDRERDQRPGHGDEELLPWRVGVPVHLHHAAEEEEVDAGDLDPRAAGGERVPELVQDDRAEEQHRGGERGRVARRLVAQDVA